MVCHKVRCEVRLVYKKHPSQKWRRDNNKYHFHKHFQTIEVRWEVRLDCVFYIVFAPIPGGESTFFSPRVNISRHESQRN